MTIPRLPPATSPLTISLTVNITLRPYFTQWYQAAKEVGETPAQFAIRQLKNNAKDYYLGISLPIENDIIETAKKTDLAALGEDIKTFDTELKT